LTDAGGDAHEVGCRTGSSSKQNLAARSEAQSATWLIVWGIIIGIWADWFIALVIISIAQSMWQSRDRWRLQTKIGGGPEAKHVNRIRSSVNT
jgi:hypothetical protein